MIKKIFVFGWDENHEKTLAECIGEIGEYEGIRLEIKTAYQMNLRGRYSEIPTEFDGYLLDCSLLENPERTAQLRQFKEKNPQKKFYLNNHLPNSIPEYKKEFFDREYKVLRTESIKQILSEL